MIANGNTYCRVITPILPSEYQEVEYIQSSGTQYIDTGIKFNSNADKFKIDYQVTNLNGNYFIAGSGWMEAGKIWVYHYKDNNIFAIYITNVNSSQKTFKAYDNVNLNRHVILYDNKQLFVDGELTASSSETFGETPYNFSLFWSTNSRDVYYSKVKIFSFKMIKNNTLVRNLIPCYRKSDNVIGMYDTVNKVFYTNQGTGTFLKGNNVVHTIRYKIPTEERPYISGHVTDGSSTFTFKVNKQDITVPVDSNGNWKWYVDRTITSLRQAFFGYTTFELNYIDFVNINVSSITDIYQIIGTDGTWSTNDPLCVLNMSKCKGILKIQTFNYVIYRSHTNWILPNIEGNIQNNSSASTVEAGGTINGNIYIGGCPLMDKNKVLSIIKAAINNNTYTLHSAVYNKCKSGGEWYTDIQAAIDAKAQQGYTVTLISA